MLYKKRALKCVFDWQEPSAILVGNQPADNVAVCNQSEQVTMFFKFNTDNIVTPEETPVPDCTGNPFVDTDGVCYECGSNEDCTGNANGNKCYIPTGECVKCATNDDCSDDEYCNMMATKDGAVSGCYKEFTGVCMSLIGINPFNVNGKPCYFSTESMSYWSAQNWRAALSGHCCAKNEPCGAKTGTYSALATALKLASDNANFYYWTNTRTISDISPCKAYRVRNDPLIGIYNLNYNGDVYRALCH